MTEPSTFMVNVRIIFWGVFIVIYLRSGHFINIVIPLPLVGYERTIANSVIGPRRAVIGQFSGPYSSVRPANVFIDKMSRDLSPSVLNFYGK